MAHLLLSLPLLPLLLHLGLLLCLLPLLLPPLLLSLLLGLLLLLASRLLLPHLLLAHLLLALLVGRHLFEADLWLTFSLLVLNPRLTHALDVHLRLTGPLDRGLDLTLRRLHLHLGLRPLDLNLGLLLRLPDGYLRLRHLHLNLWLRHLHSDLGLRHADRDLRLRLLNRDGRRRDLNRNLWLRLADGHLRLGLLDGDARSRRSKLHLRWTLLNRYLRLPLVLLSELQLARLGELLLTLLLHASLAHSLQGVSTGLLVGLRSELTRLIQSHRGSGRVTLKALHELLAGIGRLRLLLAKLLLSCALLLPFLLSWLNLGLRLLLRLLPLRLGKRSRHEGGRPEQSRREQDFHLRTSHGEFSHVGRLTAHRCDRSVMVKDRAAVEVSISLAGGNASV